MRIETELTWPTAVLENVVQLLSKTSTADRPITLTQALYRVWERLRKSTVSSWSRAKAAHWDRAVAGSSALRAALARQTSMEIHSALGFSVAQTLLDVEKFYDYVPWSTVVNTAYAVGYPLVVLTLGLQLPSGAAAGIGKPKNQG